MNNSAFANYLTIVAISTIVLLGCNKSDLLEVYPVEGSVIVKGKPASGVQVRFFGTDEVLKSANAPFPQAITESDGSFNLTSYAENDGAPAGNYVVTLVWPAAASDDPEIQDAAIDRLRGRYAKHENSPIEVSIEPGANLLDAFEIK